MRVDDLDAGWRAASSSTTAVVRLQDVDTPPSPRRSRSSRKRARAAARNRQSRDTGTSRSGRASRSRDRSAVCRETAIPNAASSRVPARPLMRGPRPRPADQAHGAALAALHDSRDLLAERLHRAAQHRTAHPAAFSFTTTRRPPTGTPAAVRSQYRGRGGLPSRNPGRPPPSSLVLVRTTTEPHRPRCPR